MDITKILNTNRVILDMQATNKAEAIEELTNLLKKDGAIDCRETFIKDVWQREAEGSTGFENHIAIPHGKSSAVINTTLAIGQMCIRDSDSRQREWLRGCNGLSLWKPDVFLPGELSGISGWLSFEQVHLRKIY